MKTEAHVREDGSKTVYRYDDQDHHVRTTDYDPNEKITCDIHYLFD